MKHLINRFKGFGVPQEKCGVFGVYGKGMEAARLVHTGLWSLQHRGQESSGIASSEGVCIRVIKDEGLVSHVYNEEILTLLSGFCAIGHNRYGTSGGSGKIHAQPVISQQHLIALAHNGNLPQTIKLEQFLRDKNIYSTTINDSEMMHTAIEYYFSKGKTLPQSIKLSFPLFTGVFSMLVMSNDCLVAVRDTNGIRPLCIGKLNGGFVFSSETCALDAIGATYIRDVLPGEMVIVDESGLKSVIIAKGEVKLDVFEFVYFSRPDSVLLGQSVNQVRKNLGKYLAMESLVKADVVIPVPDSAIPAALGYAQFSGIPFDHGLIKNRYIHRTFIRPAQKLRENDVAMKLNPLPDVFFGKRVVVVDDSIVRGTTAKKLVDRLKSVGAKEIHLMISSPPVKYPDFYGTDTPNQKDLIGSRLSIAEIKDYLGVDSLHFLSYEGLIKAVGVPENQLCTSCFTGKYPLDIGEIKKTIRIC